MPRTGGIELCVYDYDDELRVKRHVWLVHIWPLASIPLSHDSLILGLGWGGGGKGGWVKGGVRGEMPFNQSFHPKIIKDKRYHALLYQTVHLKWNNFMRLLLKERGGVWKLITKWDCQRVHTNLDLIFGASRNASLAHKKLKMKLADKIKDAPPALATQ